jgi:hypothetical protein
VVVAAVIMGRLAVRKHGVKRPVLTATLVMWVDVPWLTPLVATAFTARLYNASVKIDISTVIG